MASGRDRRVSASQVIANARTFLFVPASRPDRFLRAHASGADVVILDLEDAVSPPEKPSALGAVVTWVRQRDDVGPVTMVRINGVGSPWHDAEVSALRESGVPLMVPKAECLQQLDSLHLRASRSPLVALVETARGVLHAESVACGAGVVRLALGHMDLAAAIGVDPDCYDALRHARSQLVLASAVAGHPPPIDGVTTALDDAARQIRDVEHAVALGFGAKLCIHPRQVAVVHEALQPSVSDVAWAKRVVAAVDDGAVPDGGGAVAVDGKMVDPPVIARARAIVARARAHST